MDLNTSDCYYFNGASFNLNSLAFPIASFVFWLIYVIKSDSLSSRRRKLFSLIFIFRLVNSLQSISILHPDEIWQSEEVAHNVAFGYGYLPWEWQAGIRSWLYPVLYAIPLKILGLLRIDSQSSIFFSNKILSALVAAAIDYYAYAFALRSFGKDVAWWALLCSINFWYYWFVSIKAFSNVFECLLTLMAMYYWPWTGFLDKTAKNEQKHAREEISLVLAFTSCMIRPSSAILWIVFGLWECYARGLRNAFRFCFWKVIPIGTLTMLLLTAIDYWMYGFFVFGPWEFFRVNILQGVSTVYGIEDKWFYLISFRQVFSLAVPFIFLSVVLWGFEKRGSLQIFVALSLYILALSTVKHKETRFIYPIMPMCLLYFAIILEKFQRSNTKPQRNIVQILRLPTCRQLIYIFLVFVAGWNAFLSIVYGSYHCTGYRTFGNVLAEMDRTSPIRGLDATYLPHSTPFYTVLHRNVPLVEVVHGHVFSYLKDNSLDLYANKFWKTPFWKMGNITQPSHILMWHFPSDLEEKQKVLERYHYQLCAVLENYHYVTRPVVHASISCFCHDGTDLSYLLKNG